MELLTPLQSNTGVSEYTTNGYHEQTSSQNEAFIQSSPYYNFLPSNFRTFTSGSGTATVADKMFKVTTGTSVGGYGAIQSFRSLNYKTGLTGLCRFSAIFTTNVANSWQGVGLINLGDELSFGYNGTDFGVWHRYNGLAEVRTITITGAASGSENLTLTLNSVAYTIPLTSGTTAHNAYEISNWLNNTSNQSVWVANQIDSTVIISAQADGAKSGTYSFSSSSATGTIASNITGVTKTSDFVAQSSWNMDTVSWLDPSKGNVYNIVYKYTGFGEINYYVEYPDTGGNVLVHTIKYGNANTTPCLGNPSLRTGLYCVSLGSTTDLTVYCASTSAFLQGTNVKIRNPRAYSNTKSITNAAFKNIFTIRNRRTYNYYYNQVEIEPIYLTLASEATKNCIVEVRATTDTELEQNFTNVGTNLVSDVDVSDIAFTGGVLLTSVVLSNNSRSASINLSEFGIKLPPSLHIVISAKLTGGSAADVTATLTWYEDV